MSRNSLVLLVLALTACDGASVGNRTQRSGEVKVSGVEEIGNNSSAALEGVGAPMAWRVVQGAAFYGAADQPPQFALRCDRGREQIVFERAGGGATLSLSAGGNGASLGTRAVGENRVQARSGMGDAVLDAMARSQSQISVGGGPEALTIPGGIAVRRVLDYCRKPPEPVAPEPASTAVEPPAEPAPVEPPA
jgi:hypothetical protein